MGQIFSKFVLACALLILSSTSAAATTAVHPDAENIHFLVLSDIHFDPFIYCNKKPCPLILKLKRAPISEWNEILQSESKKLSSYRQDTNYPLLTSALNAAKEAADKHHVQWLLVLGDFLGHDYRDNYKRFALDRSREGYEQFAKKTMDFLAIELEQTFPAINIYPLVGNNDTYSKDYYIEPNGRALKDFQTAWLPLIKNSENKAQLKATFNKAGFYAFTIPRASLRVIMLNSVLFSTHFKNKSGARYANEQLIWLQDQLKLAHQAHQKVIIGMHIPMGIDVYATLRTKLFTLIQLWQTKYIQNFKEILAAHAQDIAGIFAGHLHADWFQIVTFKQNDHEIPVIGTPAISPLFGNNPGFKIYMYSPAHQRLENFITYYYPLSQNGPWKVEYDFHSAYQPHCTYCTLTQGIHKLRSSSLLGSVYRKFYSTSTESQPISQIWLPYWCFMKEFLPHDYHSCLLNT